MTTTLQFPLRPNKRTLFARVLLRRCPLCAHNGMFENWFRIKARCDSCGFRFDRGEAGYFTGAFTINLVAAELIVAGVLVGFLFLTWPNVPWEAITWTGAIGAVAGVLLFYPYTGSAWLAIDLFFRPALPHEFREYDAATTALHPG